MDPDKQHEMYQQAFKAGQEHSNPSPKTLEEISCLKINFARMEEKFDSMSSRMEEKFEDITTLLRDSIINQEKINNANESRFANKWVEKIIIWGGSIIGTSLLIYIVNHFLEK